MSPSAPRTGLGLLVSVVLPVLVGLVTTRVINSGVQAVLLLTLSTANGFLVEFAAPGPGYNVGTAAVLALVSLYRRTHPLRPVEAHRNRTQGTSPRGQARHATTGV